VAQALGGGGHRQAAGCTFQGDLAAAEREILPRLRQQLS
jgi:nanoRNase/pAp phosphatase (c-di-AMP/oligoRNAs hydrolase)